MRQLTITALGTRLVVRVRGREEGAVAAQLRRMWSRCSRKASLVWAEPVNIYVTDTGPARTAQGAVVWGPDSPRLYQQTTQAVTRELIAAQAGRLLMFHAAAVSHPTTGSSAIFIASGGTGKTTLSRLLGDRYAYLTDETVGIDQEGTIVPYPKPLSVRDHDVSHKWELPPHDLGLIAPHVRATVGQIVLLNRIESGPDVPVVEELALFDAIQAIAPESSSLARLDRGLHRLAQVIGESAPVQRWTYREATTLVPLVGLAIGAP